MRTKNFISNQFYQFLSEHLINRGTSLIWTLNRWLKGKLLEKKKRNEGKYVKRDTSLLEVQVFECEVGLHDSCGFDPRSEDVLFSRDIWGLGYPVQGI